MDGCERRDCVIFDGKRIKLGLFRPRNYYFKRAVALAVTTCALLLIGAFVGIAVLRGDIIRSLEGIGSNGIGGNGIAQSENGGDNFLQDGENDLFEESLEKESRAESEEDSEPPENDGNKEESDAPSSGEGTATVDMSYAERGDAFIINYTDVEIDSKGILEMGFLGGRYAYSESPVVLILHTHTSELYSDADGDDPLRMLTHSVVTVGERLAQELTGRGVPAVHCAVIHDNGENAYASAADTIETMLRIYPSIEYVIDLHRAEETDGYGNPIKSLSSAGTAQIRFTVSRDGVLTRDTLALALSLRRELNLGGERICMPVVFTDSEYNATLAAYYLKIDVGTGENNIEEAMAAGLKLAEALAELMKK